MLDNAYKPRAYIQDFAVSVSRTSWMNLNQFYQNNHLLPKYHLSESVVNAKQNKQMEQNIHVKRLNPRISRQSRTFRRTIKFAVFVVSNCRVMTERWWHC